MKAKLLPEFQICISVPLTCVLIQKLLSYGMFETSKYIYRNGYQHDC